MTPSAIEPTLKARLLKAQQGEITEHFIYKRLARAEKNPHNAGILRRISADELRHYNLWKEHTQQVVPPQRLKIWLYYLSARVFGLTFSLKLMEKGEAAAQVNYHDIAGNLSSADSVASEESMHEDELLKLIDEERMRYMGAIIRGLNEALVEIAGALTGFSLVFHEARLVATAGFISAIAMSLSLAGTEYLATKSEEHQQRPGRAAAYTGLANFVTVVLLVVPYLVLDNMYLATAIMLALVIVVILLFSFYVSVARDISFRRHALEMSAISLGIAAVTFAIGYAARNFLHIEI